LIVHRSDRSGFAALSVTTHELPPDAPSTITPARDAYCFWYRPRREKGVTRVTVPELNLNCHRISRDHILVFPPSLLVHGEQEGADGKVVRFSFAPRFFEEIADSVGLRALCLKRFWHDFFAIDQGLEALCRLLMEETEAQCPHGPLYFESLARALAVDVLSTVRDQYLRKARTMVAPPGIRRAVQCLETDFVGTFSLTELAAEAQLSRSHFAQTFRQTTGHTPHQYLLLVRLNHARKLLVENQAMPLSEIAVACGFFDQAHLSRHFRQFFGMTPRAFRLRQGCR
jgi:AraC-like DNA-binding protein